MSVGDELDLHLFKTYGQLPSASFVALGEAEQFDSWISECRDRQLELFATDVTMLVDDELAEFVNKNTLALLDEVHELLHTVNWKPWATKNRGTVDIGQVLDELPDVMFFLGNLLAAFGVTGEEVEHALHVKDEIVRMRADGYDPSEQMNYRQLFLGWHGTGPWICWFCSDATDFNDLAIHHVDEDRTNSTRENLVPTHKGCHARHHAKARTAKNRMTQAHCDECDRDFTVAGLQVHNRHVHGQGRAQPTAYIENQVATTCDVCGQVCRGARGIITHKRKMHSDRVKVKCVVCDIEFIDRSAAMSHQRLTHDAEMITCPVCDRVCKGRGAYHMHVTETHGNDNELVPCPQCDRHFNGSRGLKIHQHRAHGIQCPECRRDLTTVVLIRIEDADGSSRQACPCGKVL